MVRLVGPGGSGKSTTGALLAARLGVPFVDLDRYFSERAGDISEFIREHGYENYARANIESYCSLLRHENWLGVMALSSGFMTYELDAHPEYSRVRSEVELCACELRAEPASAPLRRAVGMWQPARRAAAASPADTIREE